MQQEQEVMATGNYIPVSALNAYFNADKKADINIAGAVGYGAYYTTESVTIPAICVKVLWSDHCLNGHTQGYQYTLCDKWIGGQAFHFNESNSGMVTDTWDADLHRENDSPDDKYYDSPAVRSNIYHYDFIEGGTHYGASLRTRGFDSKSYTWGLGDKNYNIDYMYATNDRKAYYINNTAGGLNRTVYSYAQSSKQTTNQLIVNIDVQFPSDRNDISTLRAILFYSDGTCGYVKGKTLDTIIETPGADYFPTQVSVGWDVWDEKTTDHPPIIVAYYDSGAKTSMLYSINSDGTNTKITKIAENISKGYADNLISSLKVNWRKTPYSEIMCCLQNGALYYTNDSSGQWAIPINLFTSPYYYLPYYSGGAMEILVNWEPGYENVAYPAVLMFSAQPGADVLAYYFNGLSDGQYPFPLQWGQGAGLSSIVTLLYRASAEVANRAYVWDVKVTKWPDQASGIPAIVWYLTEQNCIVDKWYWYSYIYTWEPTPPHGLALSLYWSGNIYSYNPPQFVITAAAFDIDSSGTLNQIVAGFGNGGVWKRDVP